MAKDKKLAHKDFEDEEEKSSSSSSSSSSEEEETKPVAKKASSSSSSSEKEEEKAKSDAKFLEVDFPYPIGVKGDKEANKLWMENVLCAIESEKPNEDLEGCIITKPGEYLPQGYKIGDPPKGEDLSKYVWVVYKEERFGGKADSKFKNMLRRADGKFVQIVGKYKNAYHPHAKLPRLRELGLLEGEYDDSRNVVTTEIPNPSPEEGDPDSVQIYAPFLDPELLCVEMEKEKERLVKKTEKKKEPGDTEIKKKNNESAEPKKKKKKKKTEQTAEAKKKAPKNASKFWSRSATLTRLGKPSDEKEKKMVKGDSELLEQSRKLKTVSLASLTNESVAVSKKAKPDRMDVDKAPPPTPPSSGKKRKTPEKKQKPSPVASNLPSVFKEVYDASLAKKGEFKNVLEDVSFDVQSIASAEDLRAKFASDDTFGQFVSVVFSAVYNYPEVLLNLLPKPKQPSPPPAKPAAKKKPKMTIDL